jgi:solute carrier family 25 citrate transporter 1
LYAEVDGSRTKYPTEYVKTRKQLSSTAVSPIRLLTEAIRNHGVRVLYTGAGAFCISNASKSGVRFLTFDAIRSHLPVDADTGKPTKVSNMLAGVASGVAESITVVTPGESIKTRIVEDRAGAYRFKTTGDAIRGILAVDGISGFYRGIIPVTLKQGSNALARFTSYNTILEAIRPSLQRAGRDGLAAPVAGAVAGVITVYATMPFDTVKTEMQSLQSGASKKGMVESFALMLHRSGIQGLWKGTTPRLVRVSVSSTKTLREALVFILR